MEIPTRILLRLHDRKDKKEVANEFGLTIAEMRKEVKKLDQFVEGSMFADWGKLKFSDNGENFVIMTKAKMIEAVTGAKPAPAAQFLEIEQLDPTDWIERQIATGELNPGSAQYAIGKVGCVALHLPETDQLKSKVFVQAQGRYPDWYEIVSAAQLMPKGTPFGVLPQGEDFSVMIIDLRDNVKETFKFALCCLADALNGIAIPISDMLDMQTDKRQLHIFPDGDVLRMELNDPE